MAERTARLGSMFYQDSDGQYRRALAGETIQVHPDYLERFDRLNVLMGEGKSDTVHRDVTDDTPEQVEEKPKPRRGRPRKTTS